MSWGELLLGRPLRSEEQESQKIGPLAGVPVMGLDALASAAYGPEAALTVLLPLGLVASRWVGPISAVILALLFVVYLSYRQTIAAYPNGGGSYTVAHENLGAGAGLVAAAALATDYVLNVAVAISSGVGAIVSAAPALLPHTLALCLTILVLMTIVNLRGVREAGLLFMAPTYLFVGSLGLALAIGVAKTVLAGGHPAPVVAPPRPVLGGGAAVAGAWLAVRAFASGCTAMTGVEAVSNGVPLFRDPTVPNARRTLTIIIVILAVFLAGIAFLAGRYGITATDPGRPGYQSVISILVAAVAGRGWFYYVTIASTVSVLCLSANTSFADFPRLCRVLALDEYLPAEFAHLGRRLVYSEGIVVLALLAAVLLIAFGGITDRLIPLFAVGAFLAFTMSQAGMVMHWRREQGRHARVALVVNGAGALATAATVLVVVVSKFVEGAWVTVLVIVGLVLLFRQVRRTADRIGRETGAQGPLLLGDPPQPIVVIPIKELDRVARKAIRLGVAMSADVRVVQVQAEQPGTEPLAERWCDWVETPARKAGFEPPRFVALPSEYREFFGPVLDYVKAQTREHPQRPIAVVIPELVDPRWHQQLFRSHRPTLLKGLLLLRGGPHVVVVSTPWYLKEPAD